MGSVVASQFQKAWLNPEVGILATLVSSCFTGFLLPPKNKPAAEFMTLNYP